MTLDKLIVKVNGNNLSSLISSGNHKLPETTAIFNISPATYCISRKLGLCKAQRNGRNICYAMKAEKQYKDTVLPYRRKQAKYWNKVSAEKFALDFIVANLNKKTKYNKLRINESGDFRNQKDVEKAEKIATILKNHGIIVYCYTSRSDLNYTKVKNLIVNGSGFRKSGVTNVFKIIGRKEEKPKGYGLCVGNCRICNRCTVKGTNTCVREH